MSTEMIGFLIKAGAVLLFIIGVVVCLNWARHPGRRRGGRHASKAPDPDSPEALKKSLVTMDRILVAMGIFLFLFVATMVVLFARYQSTPDVLIGAVFGFCGFEAGAMAAIKRRKDTIRERLRDKQGKATSENKEGTP